MKHFHAQNSAYSGDPKETTYRTRAGATAMLATWRKTAKAFGFTHEMRNGVLRVTERSGVVVTASVVPCDRDCEVRSG